MIPRNEQNVLDFLMKIRAQWPKRFESDDAEEAWLGLMIDELKGFEAEVLVEAAKLIMRKKLRGFPLLGECTDACVEAKRAIDWRKPKLAMGADSGPRAAVTFGRYESLADTLIAGPEGREAARNGYVGSLWDFIAKHGRLPDQREKAGIIRCAAETDELYADLLRGARPSGHDGVDRVVLRSVELMLERREDMRQRVLGETP